MGHPNGCKSFVLPAVLSLSTCPLPEVTPPETALALFDYAIAQLTWQHVRDHLPVDDQTYWTIATAGPLSLLARAATDHTASLTDWTTREDSPGLFAAADTAQLWHLGLMVEVACSGTLLAHESMWACCLDCSTHTTERDSYAHFLDIIKELSVECMAYVPQALSNRIKAFQTAANVICGLEEPYTRTVGF